MKTSLCCAHRRIWPQNSNLTDSTPHKWEDHITHQMCSNTFDAGNLHVRFDEREQETESGQTGLRRVMRKHPNSHREAKATAPVLDSTPDYTQMHLAPRKDE